jgi:hypothetical protein
MAKKRNKPNLEEVKARITKIVSTMSETELEKFLAGLEEWRQSNPGKREHARKDLSITALFMLGSYFFRDSITNIGAGGLFLETNTPVAVGQTVTISFALSENEPPIEVKGKIVRVTANGFGVKFKEPLTAL